MNKILMDLLPPRVRRTALVVVVMLAGVVSFAHPSLLSGLNAIQADPGDTRFNNYVLEHGFRWVKGEPGHRRFWDPPMYHPTSNVAAYSDILLGSAPIYWGFRAMGIPPDTSSQLWVIALVILNFLAGYLLFTRGMGLGHLSGAGGAFYFAFAGIRVVGQGHQQLLPQFFSVIALFALLRIIQGNRESRPCSWAHWLLLSAGVVLQLYAGYYLGWFLCFGLSVGLCVWLAQAEGRRHALLVVRRDWPGILTSLLLAGGALYWMAPHYLRAMGEISTAPVWHQVSGMVPRFQSWLNPGPHHLFLGWVEATLSFPGVLAVHEHRIAPGLISLSLAAFGLYRGRRSLGVKILTLASIILFLLALSYPGGWTPWRLVFNLVPGASAIRAVARISFLFLIPLSVGIALCLNGLRSRRIACLLLLAVGVEQLQEVPSFDKQQTRSRVERLASQVPESCSAFFYAPSSKEAEGLSDFILQIDAMWAQMATGVPTVNGYSGNAPRHWWPLRDNHIGDPQDAARLRSALGEWRRVNNLTTQDVCVVGSDLQAPP